MKFYIIFIAIILKITYAFGNNVTKQQDIINFPGYEIKISERNEDTGVTAVEIARNGKVIEKLENDRISLSQAGYLKFAGDKKAKPYIILSS